MFRSSFAAVILWTVLVTSAMLTGMSSLSKAIETPVVQPFLIPNNVRLGTRLVLFCTVSQGDAPLKFIWYHNGKELPIESSEDNNESKLKINKIKASDIGNYTCLVSNAAGYDSYTVKLEVEAPPIWEHEPQDTDAVLDSKIQIQCSAIGHPLPKISWLKDQDGTGNNFVEVLSDTRRIIFDNGTLLIAHVTNEDGGYYKCQAQNGIQPGITKIMKLTVRVPPRLIENFQVENVRKGEAAILKCQAVGDQPISITWKKGSKVLVVKELERVEIIHKETPTGTMSELRIRQTERTDGGIFACSAKNSVGEKESNIELIIAEPPSAPLSVTVNEVSSRSVRVSWRPAVSSSDEPLVGYLVRYWKTAGGSKKLKEIEVAQDETTIFLKELNPGTSYTAKVLAKNAIGYSEPSKPAGFRTREEAPSAAPTDIKVESVGTHEIAVSWKTPPAEYWNGILKGYHIGHRQFASSSSFSYKSLSFAEYQADDGVFIRGLDKGTKYAIIVKAFNEAGSGSPSHEIHAETLGGEPPASPVLTIPEVSLFSARITWFPLNQKIQPIMQYLLQYRREGSEWLSLHIPADRDYLMLNHLEQGKRYDLKIAAYNKYGRGNFSRPVAITTDSGFTIGEEGPKEVVPVYLQSHLVVPGAIAFVVIVTAIVVAWVCYKKHMIQQQQAIESQIPPDQMYPYDRNSIAQSDGYCDISRIPLYLQQNGMIPAESLGRRQGEETYDTPWDTNTDNTAARNEGNYTRLKNTPHTSAVVVSARNR